MKKKTCIIIPCYNVKNKVMLVVNSKFLSNVNKIVLIDDKCPQKTGLFLKKKLKNKKRFKIITNSKNLGVGGATIKGLDYAKKKNFDIIIKIDGDDQHNLSIIKKFQKAIYSNKADFCKGYRELSIKKSKKIKMPLIRLLGAKSLSLLTKINSGFWDLKDPCHGLIAFNSQLLKKLDLKKIKKNYFFEQDIILNVVKLNGKIKQFRNEVKYSDETSNLNPLMSILPFLYYHFMIFLKNLFS